MSARAQVLMTSNPTHYVPGMGYKKMPMPRAPDALDQIVARVRCGEVELKLTLSAKLLAKPLRAALVEPFLKVHNKRAPAAVEWDQVACIKVGGVPLPFDDLEAEVTAATALTPEALKQKSHYRETISVDLLTAVPSPLLSGFVAVAREPPQAHDDPPMVTEELLKIGEAAATSDEADADMSRRCSNAFQKIADGAEAVSVSAIRAALLEDEYVRSLCFPEASPHVAALDGAVRRMATNRRVRRACLPTY